MPVSWYPSPLLLASALARSPHRSWSLSCVPPYGLDAATRHSLQRIINLLALHGDEELDHDDPLRHNRSASSSSPRLRATRQLPFAPDVASRSASQANCWRVSA